MRWDRRSCNFINLILVQHYFLLCFRGRGGDRGRVFVKNELLNLMIAERDGTHWLIG